MEALIFNKLSKTVTLENVEKPKIVNDDDVIVQVLNCGVCGTDVHIFHGALTNVGEKFIPGHETGGTVIEVGKKVTSVKVGDKVAIDPNRGCHKCEFCRRAQPHFCPKGSFNDAIGIVRNGGFSQFVVSPEEQIYKVPKEFNLDLLCLVEPLSCVLHGWRKLTQAHSIEHTANILIQGAGIIGTLWASLLHYKGYRDVTVSEPSENRRKNVESLNLDFQVVSPMDLNKKEFLIVIDCSGSPIAIESGINRVKHGGIFIQFGVAAQGATCKINPFHIYEREITIQGVMVNPWTFPEAIALIKNMKDRYLDLDRLGVKKFKLSEFETCFEQLGNGTIGKASFVPN